MIVIQIGEKCNEIFYEAGDEARYITVAMDPSPSPNSPPGCWIKSFEARPSKQKKDQPFGWSFLFGAGDEARTRYLHLGKVALYRMSYTRMGYLG